jgi:hypothetical protein
LKQVPGEDTEDRLFIAPAPKNNSRRPVAIGRRLRLSSCQAGFSRIHAVKDFLTTDGHRWTRKKNVVFKHRVKRIT